MLICNSCGVTLPEGASFCPNCGLQLTAENISEPPKPLPPTGNADMAVTPETALLLSEQTAPQRGKWHFHPAHLLLALPALLLLGFVVLIVVALNASPAVDKQEPNELFHEGLVPVLVGDGSSEPLWGYMDSEGNQVIEGKFDQVLLFHSNGLAAVCQLGKWGFVNKSGEFVIPAVYEDAKSFGECDYAPVKASGSWGYINEDGVFVVNPQFDSAEQFAENGLAMVQILRYSGSNDVKDLASGEKMSMIFYMAEALSKVGRGLYVVISPIIGVLGSFISGSNTVAVTLFSNLQYQAADNLGITTALMVAANTVGGGIGNMLCVNNVVAACATAGTSGKEGKIIRINAIPAVIYAVMVILVFVVAVWVLKV